MCISALFTGNSFMTNDEKIKAVTAVIALAGFLWGVYSFIQLRAVEAAEPYLVKKLAWCEEAVETAARIANADQAVPADIERFWQMYFGVMGLIEKEPIEDAMISFGEEIGKDQTTDAGNTKGGRVPHTSLQARSLAIAHACRHELSLEWSPTWSRGSRPAPRIIRFQGGLPASTQD
jgi:hypothetical protein